MLFAFWNKVKINNYYINLQSFFHTVVQKMNLLKHVFLINLQIFLQKLPVLKGHRSVKGTTIYGQGFMFWTKRFFAYKSQPS
jgi:hypothetical protein